MVGDIFLEDYAQRLAVVRTGVVVLAHRHRLTQKLLGDLLALWKLHEPPHIMPEGLEVDVGRSRRIHECGHVFGRGMQWCTCAWRAILSDVERVRHPGDVMGSVRRIGLCPWDGGELRLIQPS